MSKGFVEVSLWGFSNARKLYKYVKETDATVVSTECLDFWTSAYNTLFELPAVKTEARD